MSLSDLASLGSFVSGVAVVVSLIYLAFQIRQNTRHTRALIHQGAAARTNDIMMGLIPADCCAVWIEGNHGVATPELVRQRQFFIHCATALNAMEDHHLQHLDGLLSSEQYARGCETFRGLLLEPGFREYWSNYRKSMVQVAPKFCAFVDSLCTTDAASAFGNRV
jgi:hypothetical protein